MAFDIIRSSDSHPCCPYKSVIGLVKNLGISNADFHSSFVNNDDVLQASYLTRLKLEITIKVKSAKLVKVKVLHFYLFSEGFLGPTLVVDKHRTLSLRPILYFLLL